MAQGSKLRRIVGACAFSVSVPLLAAVPAAVNAAEATPAVQGMFIEEIIVTARLREENLQAVPLSAYVLASRLDNQALSSLSDISQVVSGLKFEPTGRSNEQYMRGVGSGNNASFNQSVATFVDGVYHGRSRASGNVLFDIDRIEVLKGPQSTYFGNNAIAGAIHIISKKPGEKFSSTSRALYGDFGTYGVESALSTRFSDSLAMRVAAVANGQEGWLQNIDGSDSPDEDNLAGRVSFEFDPSGGFDASLKLEASSYDQKGGLVQQAEFCPPDSRFVPAGFCNTLLAINGPVGVDNDRNAFPPGQLTELDTAEGVLTMHWSVGERSTITSITSYYTYDYNLQVAGNPTPVPLITATVPEEFDQVSQELRIASDTEGDWEYLAGLYYLNEDLEAMQDTNFLFLTPTIQSNPAFASIAALAPLGQRVVFDIPAETYSVFGSLGYKITDDLKIGAGVRATRVEKDIDQTVFYGTATQPYGGVVAFPNPAQQTVPGPLNLGVPGSQSASRSDDDVTPSAQIQYTLGSAMVYASYTRGFKAGGFNGVDLTGNPANLPYDPEEVTAYETGLKSQFLDGRLTFNTAVFYSEYEDLQVVANTFTSTGAVVSSVKNAASAISRGVEIETRWMLTDRFALSIEGTYLDAYYDSYTNAGPTQAQQRAGLRVQDLSGDSTPLAPEWSGSLVATYVQPFGENRNIITELSVFGSTDYYLGGSGVNDDLLMQSGYGRLDARLGYQTGRFTFEVIGKNLTDREIRLAGSAVPTSAGTVITSRQTPRLLLGQVRYAF